jgi:hypothetical protein
VDGAAALALPLRDSGAETDNTGLITTERPA